MSKYLSVNACRHSVGGQIPRSKGQVLCRGLNQDARGAGWNETVHSVHGFVAWTLLGTGTWWPRKRRCLHSSSHLTSYISLAFWPLCALGARSHAASMPQPPHLAGGRASEARGCGRISFSSWPLSHSAPGAAAPGLWAQMRFLLWLPSRVSCSSLQPKGVSWGARMTLKWLERGLQLVSLWCVRHTGHSEALVSHCLVCMFSVQRISRRANLPWPSRL